MTADTFPTRSLRDHLLKVVKEKQGGNILVLSACHDFNRELEALDGVHLTISDTLQEVRQNSDAGRFAIGIICLDEEADNRSYNQLVSQMRDSLCERVYLCRNKIADPQTAFDDDAHIRALGFKRLQTSSGQPQDNGEHLYYFDIFNYKDVPDWLNSRFWSNPEMWDKARW